MKMPFPVFFCIALMAGCQKVETSAPSVRPALVQKVVLAEAAVHAVYPGEIRARHEADLGFRIGGKIVARLVDAGASVRKGQVLARLDPRDASFSAQAAKAQVAAAEADYVFALAELNRTRKLVEQRFVSQTALEAKQAGHDAARARLEQARSQASVTTNQTEYTQLLADQDGVITASFADVGQVVAAGQAVLKLARPEEKEVQISVPEHKVESLQRGGQILVAGWAKPEVMVAGRVREIAPAADSVTRTFSVRVSVLQPLPEMKLGTTANVFLGGGTEGGGRLALLPLASLTQQEGKPAVWVVDPTSSVVGMRPVGVGQYREDGVTILSGLQAGELVVIAGVHKLVVGQQVRPIEQGAGAQNRQIGAGRS